MGRLLTGRAQFRRSDFWLEVEEVGPHALVIVTVISFLVGLILAYLGADQLRLVGAQIFIADLVAIGMVREVGALMRGGVHRVHMENLKVGEHELVAVFTGAGPASRDYRRGATMNFDKGIGAKYVELKITDRVQKQQPEFVIKEWE